MQADGLSLGHPGQGKAGAPLAAALAAAVEQTAAAAAAADAAAEQALLGRCKSANGCLSHTSCQ